MSTLSAIREGFETVVEAAITGLKVYPYESDGALEYPCLVVQITDEIPYDIGALGANDIRFNLLANLYLHIQDSEAGWKEMDEYRSPVGAKSIRAAVKTGTTLNASCTYAEVVHSGEATRDRDGNDRFWEYACQFRINVIDNNS